MGDDIKADYVMIGKLLSVWSRPESRGPKPQGVIAQRLRTFRAIPLQAVQPYLQNHEHLHSQDYWFLGPSIKGNHARLFPVATVSSAPAETLALKLQVALYYETKNRHPFGVLGWRFETPDLPSDDDPTPAHPYNHAQSITGWWKGLRCLLHPHISNETRRSGCSDDSQVDELVPAFPLPGNSAPGLILAAMATLHGEPQTRRLLGYDRTILASPYGPEFRTILGETPPKQ